MVWSHYPDLSAVELKELLMSKARTYPELLVKNPTIPEDLVPFSTLSISGALLTQKRFLMSFKVANFIAPIVKGYVGSPFLSLSLQINHFTPYRQN